MENMDTGLTVPNRPKIPQLCQNIYLPNLSVQAHEFGISMKKGFTIQRKNVSVITQPTVSKHFSSFIRETFRKFYYIIMKNCFYSDTENKACDDSFVLHIAVNTNVSERFVFTAIWSTNQIT